jgi:hypothetical protein
MLRSVVLVLALLTCASGRAAIQAPPSAALEARRCSRRATAWPAAAGEKAISGARDRDDPMVHLRLRFVALTR